MRADEKEIEIINIHGTMDAIRVHSNDTINSHSKQGNTENTTLLWYTVKRNESPGNTSTQDKSWCVGACIHSRSPAGYAASVFPME